MSESKVQFELETGDASGNETANSISSAEEDLTFVRYVPSLSNPNEWHKWKEYGRQIAHDKKIELDHVLNKVLMNIQVDKIKLPQPCAFTYHCELCKRNVNSWSLATPFRDVSRTCFDSMDTQWGDSCKSNTEVLIFKELVSASRYTLDHMIKEMQTAIEPCMDDIITALDLKSIKIAPLFEVIQNFLTDVLKSYIAAKHKKMLHIMAKTGIKANNINKNLFECFEKKVTFIMDMLKPVSFDHQACGHAESLLSKKKDYVKCIACNLKYPKHLLKTQLFRTALGDYWNNEVVWYVQHHYFWDKNKQIVCPKCISEFKNNTLEMLASSTKKTYYTDLALKKDLWYTKPDEALHFGLANANLNENADLYFCYADTMLKTWKVLKIKRIMSLNGSQIWVNDFDVRNNSERESNYALDYSLIDSCFRFIFIKKKQQPSSLIQLNIFRKLMHNQEQDNNTADIVKTADPHNILPMIFSLSNSKYIMDIFQWCLQNKYFE